MRMRKAVTVFAIMGAIALAQTGLGVPTANAEPNWDAVAQCESGGNWSANTGNVLRRPSIHAVHLGRERRDRVTRRREPR